MKGIILCIVIPCATFLSIFCPFLDLRHSHGKMLLSMISLADYDYHLSKKLIATKPSSPRDGARLFVYNTRTDEIAFDTFHHIGRYVPKPSLLVFNNTKVIPARLQLKKETGGKIEVLLMMNEYRPGDTMIKGIIDRKIAVGAKLYFKTGGYLEVVKQDGQFFFFTPSISFHALWVRLVKEGVTPVPPYIKNTKLSEYLLREKYQSVLAKYPASIAAPTASLHFTRRLVDKLNKENIWKTEITLHVGMGTFASITEKNIRHKKLFMEYFDITSRAAQTITHAKSSGTPVIPVGTTALRALESAVTSDNGPVRIVPGERGTDIFIFPPYEFRIADGLITNFHVPRSSLMLLVDAFLQYKKSKRDIHALYFIAIQKKFRFYSFGDGMLIV